MRCLYKAFVIVSPSSSSSPSVSSYALAVIVVIETVAGAAVAVVVFMVVAVAAAVVLVVALAVVLVVAAVVVVVAAVSNFLFFLLLLPGQVIASIYSCCSCHPSWPFSSPSPAAGVLLMALGSWFSVVCCCSRGRGVGGRLRLLLPTCCFFYPEVWGEAGRGGGWNSDVCFVQIVSCGSLYRDGTVITPEQYQMVDVGVAVVVDVVLLSLLLLFLLPSLLLLLT